MPRLIYILLILVPFTVVGQYIPSDGNYVFDFNGYGLYADSAMLPGGIPYTPPYTPPDLNNNWDEMTADYWLCAVDGSDSNDGTSREAPIQTITKLNTILAASSEGVKVAISDTAYYGTIVLSDKTGSSGDPYILIGANKFGKGRPSIKGYKELTSWTSEGGNIYSKQDSDLPSEENRRIWYSLSSGQNNNILIMAPLIINGVQKGIAQTPNSGYYGIDAAGDSEGGYNDWFTDDDEITMTTDQFAGDYAYINAVDYVAEKARIISNTSTTFTIDQGDLTYYNLYDVSLYYNDVKYKIVNDTPDSNGEWQLDISNQRLYLYSTTNPISLTIHAPVRDSLISIDGCQYVTLKFIELWGGNFASIHIQDSDEITVDSCNIYNAGWAGIYSLANEDVYYRYDTIKYSNSNGIFSASQAANSVAYIHHCYIEDCGSLEYAGDQWQYIYTGISGRDNFGAVDIRYNHIKNTGYSGIDWNTWPEASAADSIWVYGNLIDNFCGHLSDGGAIHFGSWNDNFKKFIRKNIIINQSVNYDFTQQDRRDAMGVYIDGNSYYFTVDSNSVSNAGWAMFNQYSAYYNTYQYNITTKFNLDNMHEYWMTGFHKPTYNDNTGQYTTYKYNISVVEDATEGTAYNWGNDGSPSSTGTDIDYNIYFNPFRTDGDIIGSYESGGLSKKTLTEWRAMTPWDDNSTLNQSSWMFSDVSGIDESEFVWHFMNWSPTAHQFDLGDCTFKDVNGSNVSGTVTVPPYYSKILFYASGTLSTVEEPIYKGE